ncbi:LOW QUALITY PROTEIN: uncharacterized protein ColSpa_08845 [Colletotrichum spaethianum]|uniref:SigF-like NTF2-like domain-containing protein n=1 Tax=Colletotrichum spaethianum TaxID=700344 RepID=A0AA37PAL5_9PEZI|nr:LOW QUALITY PROTEIN: uncharacterized protein ColSpa_08845 [Colletotrichum spaethianum]GKT48664.1 LOW QUALITY PROTEIN: hypothetical protein ColSpa_08845 [Colletotrichum spaethianum]
MDHPVKEIKTVIRDLVQGSPEKQKNALYSNFTEDAAFTHPFCHVPSFGNVQIPFLSTINSRWLILMVYRWYRILSPNIEMEIESTVAIRLPHDTVVRVLPKRGYRDNSALSPDVDHFTVQDQKTNLLYVKMRQDFRLWFVPFYNAPVDFVVVLRLETRTVDANGNLLPRGYGDSNTVGNRQRQFIVSQEDHYQVGEWIKFLIPFFGYWAWHAWTLFVTGLCVIGAFVGYPLTFLFQQFAVNNSTNGTGSSQENKRD